MFLIMSFNQTKGLSYNTELPADGLNKEEIVEELTTLLGMGDFKADTGALSGVCHEPQKDRVDVVTTVYSMAAYTNPLNPDAYPGKFSFCITPSAFMMYVYRYTQNGG